MRAQPNIMQRAWRKVKRVMRREYKALFLTFAVLVGAMTFFGLTQSSWVQPVVSWWVLAVVATVLALPEAYQRLADYSGPHIIWFASAFREGFLCVITWTEGTTQMQKKLGHFWKWLKGAG